MSTWIKLGVNCVIVAVLPIGGLFALASLPEFTLIPIKWAGEQFDRPGYLAFYFVQSVLWWAAMGSIIAFGMLLLKPRRVFLYGLVSAAAIILFGQTWAFEKHFIWHIRELIFAATIPFFYWLFVHLASKRHNKSFKRDAVNGAP